MQACDFDKQTFSKWHVLYSVRKLFTGFAIAAFTA
jgi:hypothetical protein